MHRILFLPDIRLGILVSGRIPDIKKGRIIRPDIRCIPNRNERADQKKLKTSTGTR
jgi:hypothetical protein